MLNYIQYTYYVHILLCEVYATMSSRDMHNNNIILQVISI